MWNGRSCRRAIGGEEVLEAVVSGDSITVKTPAGEKKLVPE
jgi:hypothetical protein